MFTPVMVQLKGESLARFNTNAFDFIDFRFFQNRVRPPRTVHLPVKFGNWITALIIPVDQLFHLFRMPVVADKECIGCVDNNEVMNSNQSYMFSWCLHKIISR
jgi:hypothetical protein